MGDSRRLTTDRFYGGTSERIELLSRFLAYVESQHPSLSEAQGWILSNTNAQSRDAIERHFHFLSAIGLVDLDGHNLTGTSRGHRYLESSDPSILYEALRENVKGFDTILRRLQEEPLTDEGIMDVLVSEFEAINMESPGVATRHREWLQVLGYVDRSDGVNRLTEAGRRQISEEASQEPTERARVRELRRRLLQTDMTCIPPGRQSVSDTVFEAVKETYPRLCDDSYLCSDAHETGRENPEWQHVVHEALQQLADRENSRVRRDEELGTWLFLPRFNPGETYERSELHDRFGGKRQSGIAPSAEYPLVFLFTGSSGERYGYEDEIRDDGTVIYTGEGREGRMTYDHGNRAIGDHENEDRELHLFQNNGEGMVEYVGQFRCTDWFRQDLPDVNGETRSAIRFQLEPVDEEVSEGGSREPSTAEPSGPGEPEMEGESLPEDVELPVGNQTPERREITQDSIDRDERLVRRLKALYDDTCQVCGDRRRQSSSEGFSNVHHLMPLGAPHNGPDVPENVLVVCPNHHEDFENGMLTIDPQTLEVDHLYEETVTGRTIETRGDHQIGPQYVAYHNQMIALAEDSTATGDI